MESRREFYELARVTISNKFKIVKNTKLVEAREKIGLTQRKLAKELGLSEITYFNWESLYSYPSPENKKKILDFYNSKGIVLKEEEVFPERLKQFNLPREYNLYRELKDRFTSFYFTDPYDLPSTNKNELEEFLTAKEFSEKVFGLKKLNDREKEVIKMRFGFNKEGEETLEEIGIKLNLTRERVRQIEVGALNKIRKKLKCF